MCSYAVRVWIYIMEIYFRVWMIMKIVKHILAFPYSACLYVLDFRYSANVPSSDSDKDTLGPKAKQLFGTPSNENSSKIFFSEKFGGFPTFYKIAH